MNSNLEQMNITVAKQTAEILRQEQQLTGLSAGEIIDRVLLKICVSDTDIASLMICEYLLLVTNTQTEEQIIETIFKAISILLVSHAECHNLTYEQVMECLEPFYETYQSN